MAIDEFRDDIDVATAVENIKSMDIRGAGRIARAVAISIRNNLSNSTFDSSDQLRTMVFEWSRELYNTRPSAVSLSNTLRYIISRMMQHEGNAETLKGSLMMDCNTFVQTSLNAMEVIGDYGAHRLRSGMVILTHCNSSNALSILSRGKERGKDVKVFATESRPRHQGYITARYLREKDIDVTLIIDSAVRALMKEVDLVIVGADTITANGAVINKIGTSQVALCAHEARVPLIVAAETYKFSPETLFGYLVEIEERDVREIIDPNEIEGVNIRNPAFDATPPEYIDAIVTEEGIIPPTAAYDIIDKYYGNARPMEELLSIQ